MNKKLIKQVAKVIGKELAVHELSIVEEAGLDSIYADADTVHSAFIWGKTPQGIDFWSNIEMGRWPYNCKRGNHNALS